MAANFPFGVAGRHIVPLVVELFAFAKAQFELHSSVLQIDRKRNQSQSLLSDLLLELANLRFVHQELFGPQGIGIEHVALFIGTDMHPVNP